MALMDSPLRAVECQASGRGVTSSAIGFDRDGLDIEEEQDSGAESCRQIRRIRARIAGRWGSRLRSVRWTRRSRSPTPREVG